MINWKGVAFIFVMITMPRATFLLHVNTEQRERKINKSLRELGKQNIFSGCEEGHDPRIPPISFSYVMDIKNKTFYLLTLISSVHLSLLF